MYYKNVGFAAPARAVLYIYGLVFLVAISSCFTSKPGIYFKTLTKDTVLNGFVVGNYESKIVKGDVLAIKATSLSAAEDLVFNSGAAGTDKASGYAVDNNGNIQLHRLGTVKAEGMTRKQLAEYLQAQLAAYMKDVVVTVNYINRKVTVIGEVARPSVLTMDQEQLSVIDAIALSGDVNENAKRNDVLIVRETEQQQKQIKHINLEDHSILTSSWYYLKPNDIVYVMPDSDYKIKDERRRNLQTNLALVASGVSLLIIILDRVFK